MPVAGGLPCGLVGIYGRQLRQWPLVSRRESTVWQRLRIRETPLRIEVLEFLELVEWTGERVAGWLAKTEAGLSLSIFRLLSSNFVFANVADTFPHLLKLHR